VNNSGWTFCIVTAEGNDEVLSKCIDKIYCELEGVQNFEIIIVGNTQITMKKKFDKLKVIPFIENVFTLKLGNIRRALVGKSLKALFFKTGAISHKKNLASKNSKFDKLCFMHDYVGLESGWLKGFEKFGNDWNVCTNIILQQDGRRARDWVLWDHPLVGGPGLLPYEKTSKFMYISGGYFCVKREFFLNNPLNERLFWGEGEDVEWSLRVREKIKFYINTNSEVKFMRAHLGHPPYCEDWEVNKSIINALCADGEI
jgi:hypothetical protein